MIEALGTASKNEGNHFTVDWDGPDDPNNPKKLGPPTEGDTRLKIPLYSWTFRKKWAVTALTSAYTFLSPVSSAMIAPAAPDIAAEFHITSSVETVLTVSVFVLAYGTSQLFASHPRHSHRWNLDIFSVWTTIVRPPIGNLREGTSVADHERPVPRWVGKTNMLLGIKAQSCLAFNLGCGFAQNKSELTALRFMAGLGGGAPLAVRISPYSPFICNE